MSAFAVRAAASWCPAMYLVRMRSSRADASPGARAHTASSNDNAFSTPGDIGAFFPLGSPLSRERNSSAHWVNKSGSMATK